MLRYEFFRQLLFRLDPENAHRLTLFALRIFGSVPGVRSGLERTYSVEDQASEVSAFGLRFSNPVGLAAGYDKDGTAINGLARLGFGHIELGTVTPRHQDGNPRPRVFRLVEDEALINRMGFPNQGAMSLLNRLEHRPRGIVIGVNIGKSADTPIDRASEDYLELMQLFYGLADYLAVNVSSPNTIGLRKLQGREYLQELLHKLSVARTDLLSQTGKQCPLIVKLAPDLTEAELGDAVEVIHDSGMDGVIVCNTTTARDGLKSAHQAETGGLSGAPLLQRSTAMVRTVRSMIGEQFPIVGVGGVSSAGDAREMLSAGATLIQIYTGLVYRGPNLIREILMGLK